MLELSHAKGGLERSPLCIAQRPLYRFGQRQDTGLMLALSGKYNSAYQFLTTLERSERSPSALNRLAVSACVHVFDHVHRDIAYPALEAML